MSISKVKELPASPRKLSQFPKMLLLSSLLSVAAWGVLTGAHHGKNAAERDGAKFVDIACRAGVQFQYLASHTAKHYLLETMGAGVALFDYDNDGRLDIFLVNGAPLSDTIQKGVVPQKTGPPYWNRLYHQLKNGNFEDVTERAGLQGVGYGMGVAVGDYDNDGFEDLFVTAYGGNRLYHNNGDGTFTDVTESAGVGGSGWSTSAAFIDLDNDGLLDLVVLRYLQWDFDDIWCGATKEGIRTYCHPDKFQSITPLVYHNEGHGHFTEVGKKIGFAKPGKGLGLAIADYDLSGHLGVVVANDSMFQFLYRSNGDGTFEEVGLSSGIGLSGSGRSFAGMGVDFADYNNDGLPGIVITDLANQMYALFKNHGDRTFSYDTFASGLGGLSFLHSGWGVRFFDYDNDGWKDLLVAQGHDLDTIEQMFPHLHYRETMLLARNNGGKFVNVSAEAGDVFQQRFVGRGLAIGDIDNDGKVDAVVTSNDGPVFILHNVTPTKNHWLTLKLVGHASNRDAIGATVKIVTSGGEQSATVTTASSYLSASDKRLHFGLGADAKVRRIEIRWPSGIVQKMENIHGDRFLDINEPEGPASGNPRSK